MPGKTSTVWLFNVALGTVKYLAHEQEFSPIQVSVWDYMAALVFIECVRLWCSAACAREVVSWQ